MVNARRFGAALALDNFRQSDAADRSGRSSGAAGNRLGPGSLGARGVSIRERKAAGAFTAAHLRILPRPFAQRSVFRREDSVLGSGTPFLLRLIVAPSNTFRRQAVVLCVGLVRVPPRGRIPGAWH